MVEQRGEGELREGWLDARESGVGRVDGKGNRCGKENREGKGRRRSREGGAHDGNGVDGEGDRSGERERLAGVMEKSG